MLATLQNQPRSLPRGGGVSGRQIGGLSLSLSLSLSLQRTAESRVASLEPLEDKVEPGLVGRR